MSLIEVDARLCTRCGLCVRDCAVRVLEMKEEGPVAHPDRAVGCLDCQHCFTICPTGALSLKGLRAAVSEPALTHFEASDQLEALVKSRRSMRHFRLENVDSAFIAHLLETTSHAPTAVNSRTVRLTVIDDRKRLEAFRTEVLDGLRRLIQAGALPATHARYADFVRVWDERGADVIFRNAPHLLLASTPADTFAPVQDAMIALTTFELLAQAHGLGTLWNGILTRALQELLPDARRTLGLPEDHVIGYALVFGRPALRHARTAQRGPANIHRVA